MSFIKTVAYLARANAFIINDDVVYLNPISSAELSELQRALASDDRLGVSLGGGYSLLVYGSLPAKSDIITNLKLADAFLGDIAFGSDRLIRGYTFAGGYATKRRVGASVAVHFNLHGFRFAVGPDGQLHRSTFAVNSTLVPLTEAKTKDGGHIPDFDRIRSGNLPHEYVDNLTHLQNNIAYYAREISPGRSRIRRGGGLCSLIEVDQFNDRPGCGS